MQIAKNSDQLENSVFVIVGNYGEYMTYRYIPFGYFVSCDVIF